jgi:hypothetical protein
MAIEKVRQLIYFPSPLYCFVIGSEIRNGKKSGSGHPGIKILDHPQHRCWSSKYWLVALYRTGRGSGTSTRGDGVSQHGAARRTGLYLKVVYNEKQQGLSRMLLLSSGLGPWRSTFFFFLNTQFWCKYCIFFSTQVPYWLNNRRFF